MFIREADEFDSKAISDLVSDSLLDCYINGFHENAKKDFLADNNACSIARYMNNGDRFYTAVANGKTVGVIGVRLNSHITHFFVSREFRGKGVGKMLWYHARNACVDRGNSEGFTLNSLNSSLPIYEKFGFRQDGPAKNLGGLISTPMKLSTDLNTIKGYANREKKAI